MSFLSKIQKANAIKDWDQSFELVNKYVKNFEINQILVKKGEMDERMLTTITFFDRQMVKEMLQQAIKAFGEEHANVATSCVLAGRFFSQRGDKKTAEEYYRQGNAIYEKVKDNTGKEKASILSELGMLYYNKEEYKQAEPFFIEAVKRFKPTDPADMDDAAPILFNLAECQWKLLKFDEAFTNLELAYDMTRKKKGEDDPFTKKIHQQLVNAQLNHREILQPADDVTSEEWLDFAQRVCRYMGDSLAGSIVCRPPGMFLRGEKGMYFIMPAGDGLRIYSVDNVAPDVYRIKQTTFKEHIGKYLRDISGIPYPSMHKTTKIIAGFM